jgi:hypothetical protein
MKKAMSILVSLIAAYLAVFLVIVNYLKFLLPGSLDAALLTKIFTFMISGYAVYVLFHFPVNGYLFKFSTISKQNKIAGAYFVFTVIFGAGIFWLSRSYGVVSYTTLLSIIWVYIFVLLILKVKILAGKNNLGKMVTSAE